MLTRAQEKLIRSLETKKGRLESGLCLVEGEKNIKEAREHIEFAFTPEDTDDFRSLVDTVTPQPQAAVARIPRWTTEDIVQRNVIVILDGVQDPGNVGTILRLCLGFEASLVLIESADPSSPKVIRSSAGAFFNTPWLELKRPAAGAAIAALDRPVFRLENRGDAIIFSTETASTLPSPCVIIAGSEGQGITLDVPGSSLRLPHSDKLESLNVASALAIILGILYKS